MANRIITIGRQFGSGGHEIGLEVSRSLGIQCYDKELIALAAVYGNLDRTWLSDFDEKQANPFLYDEAFGGENAAQKHQAASSVLFRLQSEVIRSIAQREDAVIIGRCADYILREQQEAGVLRVFISAPFKERVRHKMRQEWMGRRAAEAMVRRIDRQRALYYQSYTGLEWGRRDGFDLYFDSHAQSKGEIVLSILKAYKALDEGAPL